MAINTLPSCQGASSTFVSYDGAYSTLIDHILVPVELLDIFSSCTVLDDNALNVSSHRPIVCNMRLPLADQTDCRHSSVTFPIKWRKLDNSHIEKYKNTLEESCSTLYGEISKYDNKNMLDKLYDDIVQIINTASDKCLPRSKGYKQFLKPYWNVSLNELHDAMKAKRLIWLQSGRPRGDNYESYKQYKKAKCAFRKYHRICAEQHLNNLNEVIDNAAEIDSAYFWKLVNRRRNPHATSAGKEMKFGETTYRDPEEICIQLGNYYRALYSEASDETFDEEHYTTVKTQVETLKARQFDKRSIPLFNDFEISSEMSKLLKGKACGDDSVCNEHLIHSDSQFRKLVLFMFNSMLKHSYIPAKMNIGTVITIFKCGSKRKDDPGSYRAITLMSSLLKL